MFKSRRKPFYKERRPFQLLTFLLAIPLSLIILELLARLIIGVAGKSAEIEAYEGDSNPIVTAYRLKFLDRSGQPFDGLSNRGRLGAKRSVSVGYELAGNQQSNKENPFWRINAQGFRIDRPVSVTKPEGEVRIFVLGGSTAFGQMSLNNQTTFASKLETFLNQRVEQQRTSPETFRPNPLPVYKPERRKALTLPPQIRAGQYRVINAAVPGYASGNELAQLALKILAYQPDVIVVLNGYTDLILPSPNKEVDIPHTQEFLSNAPGHFGSHLNRQFTQLISQAYLVKAAQYWLFRPQSSVQQLTLTTTEAELPLAQLLANNPAELQRRMQRYKEHLQHMARLTSAAQIPLILSIQPEITGRNTSKLPPVERSLIKELGPVYSQRIQAGYPQLAQVAQTVQQAFPTNVKTLNLYKLYYNFPAQAFHDAVHLTDEANTVLADQLFKVIIDLPQLQPPVAKQYWE